MANKCITIEQMLRLSSWDTKFIIVELDKAQTAKSYNASESHEVYPMYATHICDAYTHIMDEKIEKYVAIDSDIVMLVVRNGVL